MRIINCSTFRVLTLIILLIKILLFVDVLFYIVTYENSLSISSSILSNFYVSYYEYLIQALIIFFLLVGTILMLNEKKVGLRVNKWFSFVVLIVAGNYSEGRSAWVGLLVLITMALFNIFIRNEYFQKEYSITKKEMYIDNLIAIILFFSLAVPLFYFC